MGCCGWGVVGGVGGMTSTFDLRVRMRRVCCVRYGCGSDAWDVC
jgi:hypothetical protein